MTTHKTLPELLEELPDFAVDIKLNTKNLLNSSILSQKQVMIILLACVVTSKNNTLHNAALETAKGVLNETEINASKICAAIMSMSNIYYRFTHLVSNQEYSKMPAGLRMNSMSPSKHGIEQIDFELAATAVSSINGCGACMEAHEKVLKKHEVESVKIAEAIKIAANVYALSVIV
jgi:alkyl hydroperoxide reductase subunit D